MDVLFFLKKAKILLFEIPTRQGIAGDELCRLPPRISPKQVAHSQRSWDERYLHLSLLSGLCPEFPFPKEEFSSVWSSNTVSPPAFLSGNRGGLPSVVQKFSVRVSLVRVMSTAYLDLGCPHADFCLLRPPVVCCRSVVGLSSGSLNHFICIHVVKEEVQLTVPGIAGLRAASLMALYCSLNAVLSWLSHGMAFKNNASELKFSSWQVF